VIKPADRRDHEKRLDHSARREHGPAAPNDPTVFRDRGDQPV